MLQVAYNAQTKSYVRSWFAPTQYKYGIVKHRPRITPLLFPPDTCPIPDHPAGDDKGSPIFITPTTFKHIERINSPAGYAWARSVGNMWINIPYEVDDPNATAKAESIHCGGNFFAYSDETDTHVKVVAYSQSADLSNLDVLTNNWFYKPWLYWKACAISIFGQVINVANELDVYFPLIARTELWLVKSYVELFPDGYNYQFYGTDVYDGDSPLMTVDPITRQRKYYSDWKINERIGVIPPKV